MINNTLVYSKDVLERLQNRRKLDTIHKRVHQMPRGFRSNAINNDKKLDKNNKYFS